MKTPLLIGAILSCAVSLSCAGAESLPSDPKVTVEKIAGEPFEAFINNAVVMLGATVGEMLSPPDYDQYRRALARMRAQSRSHLPFQATVFSKQEGKTIRWIQAGMSFHRAAKPSTDASALQSLVPKEAAPLLGAALTRARIWQRAHHQPATATENPLTDIWLMLSRGSYASSPYPEVGLNLVLRFKVDALCLMMLADVVLKEEGGRSRALTKRVDLRKRSPLFSDEPRLRDGFNGVLGPVNSIG